MEDLTLITCSYNTPDITLTMLRSWIASHDITQRIILCDNSTNDETSNLLKLHNIPFIASTGASHGEGINYALNLCTTKYALLVDTDVVFLKNHSDIFKQFKDMDLTLMGKIEGDRGGKSIHKRVNPWHCFINVEDIKKHNITFFDSERMRESFSTNKIYDIGSTFLEDIKRHNLKVGDIDLQNKLFIHFEGMSWYKNKFDDTKEDTGIDFGGTHNNPAYLQAYNYKYNIYKKYEQQYRDYIISDKFIYKEPKLLIKFPTRNRVNKFFATLDKYYELLSNKREVEFLITCDVDDITMNNSVVRERLKLYKNLEVEYSNNKNKVEAINSGIKNRNFEILLLASDDMIPIIKDFDSKIITDMCNNFPDFDGVLWYNDGVQRNRLNTLCILGKKYYNRFGYIYNPEYKSLWCDMEFTQVGNILDKQKYFDEIIIKHAHHTTLNEEMDELYLKNETYETVDKDTFLRRQKTYFNLK